MRVFVGLGILLPLACSAEPPTVPAPAAPAEAGTEAALGLDDVSVLEPLPGSLDAPGWLRADSAGARGALLPEPVFAEIPEFPVPTSHALDYARLRVLGVRFDGCHGAACAAQIRLVLQPVTANGKARDSSLHLFYSLEDEEFAAVVHQLRALRELAPEQATVAPLTVSPALAAQGMTGAYATALHELVLAYCGAASLTRMTFFLRAPPTQETWFFGGFERRDDALEPLSIVGVGAGNQRVIHVEHEDGYEYVVTPAATEPENGSVLLASDAAAAATDAARSEAFASFLRLENPTRYGVDALPCAGCHLAPFVIAEAGRRFGLEASAFPDDRFAAAGLAGERGGRPAAANPSSLRAFGYFDAEPVIAPRVIHESLAVLADLEARYPAE